MRFVDRLSHRLSDANRDGTACERNGHTAAYERRGPNSDTSLHGGAAGASSIESFALGSDNRRLEEFPVTPPARYLLFAFACNNA